MIVWMFSCAIIPFRIKRTPPPKFRSNRSQWWRYYSSKEFYKRGCYQKHTKSQYEKYKQAKMKLSTIFLAGITQAAKTDDTAISTLKNLEKISSEILSSEFIIQRSNWRQRWIRRFHINTARMRESLARCGTSDGEANNEIDIDTENPCRAINQLITGFSMWTDRNIASCNGQKKMLHQKKRLKKWNNILNKGNRLKLK